MAYDQWISLGFPLSTVDGQDPAPVDRKCVYIYIILLYLLPNLMKMDETPDCGSPLGRHDFQGDKCIVTGSPAFFHGSSGQQLGPSMA